MNNKTVIVCGAPGSGKTTLANALLPALHLEYISTGDLMRAESQEATPRGTMLKEMMSKGELVPDDTVIDLVYSKLVSNKDKGWLLDGFPRTTDQAEALDFLGVRPSVVICLFVCASALIERISGRQVDPETKAIYHTIHVPPPAEVADRLTKRPDDNEVEVIKKRINDYDENIDSILEFYTSKGVPVLRVDASKPPEALYRAVTARLPACLLPSLEHHDESQ